MNIPSLQTILIVTAYWLFAMTSTNGNFSTTSGFGQVGYNTTVTGWSMATTGSGVAPAAGVVDEAMVALTVARLVQEKFGGDSALELQRNFAGYIEQIRSF